jgi:hypothetical protein
MRKTRKLSLIRKLKEMLLRLDSLNSLLLSCRLTSTKTLITLSPTTKRNLRNSV